MARISRDKVLRRVLEQPGESRTGSSKPFGHVDEGNPFGYVNEADPFVDDKIFAKPWWEHGFDGDVSITRGMMSEVLWHSVMMTAKQFRYRYIRAVPTQRDINRQMLEAMGQIWKFQLLKKMVENWVRIGVVENNSANQAWLAKNLDGMQESYQRRYNTHRVYGD